MGSLMRWLWAGHWRASPGRALTAVLAIAIGVALALAIHLVNRSALGEFGAALSVINGEAQLRLEGRTARGIDEAAYPLLAGSPQVAEASPVIELDVLAQPVSTASATPPQRIALLGIDPLRAAGLSPGLMPTVDAEVGEAEGPAAMFADDALFLSRPAMRLLGVAPGDRVALRAGLVRSTWRVMGEVPGALGQSVGVVDIGAAQWRFGWLGRISRIDLRLAPGAARADLETALADRLPADAAWTTPDAAGQRMSNLSRAYRVNLNVLALVALFTGGFIVYATIALGVVRQRRELALLAVLGAPPRFLTRVVVGQGAVLGAVGSLLGLAAGTGIAAAALTLTGGDLGGGYFEGLRPTLALDPVALLLFALLGIGVGIAGSLLPARALRRQAPAQALKDSSDPPTLHRRGPLWAALLTVAGAALLGLPPIGGLPLPAYAAIAAWLLAGIVAVPTLTRSLGRMLAGLPSLAWRHPALWFAVQRIRGAPGTASAALSGVVASVALATAMAVMVHSFRGSVEQWLDTVLPADLYGRLGDAGAPAQLPEGLSARLQAVPGVLGIDLQRTLELSLDPALAPVMLLARPIGEQAARRLPLTGALLQAPPGLVPIHVSEAMVSLHDFAPGQTLSLPIGPPDTRYFVASVWRDYARQHGTIAIDTQDYQRLTGDTTVNDLSLRLASGTSAQAALEDIRALVPELEAVDFRSASELRALSLRIFDRSFAVTYALEAIAILVGLFGVAATYAGEALARAREFGMLRHLGLTRRGVMRSFALESGLLLLAGIAWGAGVGALIAGVLVHRVNPQSFHWTMDMAWPLPLLAASGLALLGLGVAAATLASRQATSAAAVRAVREDW